MLVWSCSLVNSTSIASIEVNSLIAFLAFMARAGNFPVRKTNPRKDTVRAEGAASNALFEWLVH
jgi:hypothetical protein